MSHAPTPYRIRGDEIDPPEDDFEEREEAWDRYQEDKFEQEHENYVSEEPVNYGGRNELERD